jgi:UDP-N-acetylglucosamine--N-acetylmuramyl-(pentapeptide) pyrophosphoryl-undecaprenol N-acetylglucosamine transferase
MRTKPRSSSPAAAKARGRLNELSAEAAAKFPVDTQVLHIAGALDFERVSEITQGRPGHKVLGFCDQMPSAYALADLVIARSGASSPDRDRDRGAPVDPGALSLSQRTIIRPAMQRFLPKRERPSLVQERDLDAERLASLATSILQDLPTYKRMAKAARALAIPDAAERVCAAIEATLSHSMNVLSQRLTDTSSPLRIHLIGVAGSGMSGLALLLLGMGHSRSADRTA